LGSLETQGTKLRQQENEKILDPLGDGWETENHAEKIGARLKQIAELLEHADRIDQQVVRDWVAEDFACGPLRPPALKAVFDDGLLRVQRPPDGETQSAPVSHHGASGLAEALRALVAGMSGAEDVHAKFKVFRVHVSPPPTIDALAYYQASGTTHSGAVQQTATWRMTWVLGPGGQPQAIQRIEVSEYEEAVANSPSRTLFSDCTESILGANASYRDQLKYGSDYWMQRLPAFLSPHLLQGHMGIAVGDVNGDELDDLYVCQPAALPNRLYVQTPSGTLEDVSASAGIDILDWSNSALLVDLDNDGDQDLAVLTGQALLLFANNGRAKFTLRGQIRGQWEYGVTAADFEQDSDLDLYVCNYFADATEDISLIGRRDPLHNSNTGGRNVLLRNEGNFTFSDVTDETGLNENNTRWSYAAAWDDYDNDGDVDLYVANDFGPNNLYRNDGGRFADVAPDNGALDPNFGMSVSWGDYNRDGFMDLYIANMFSSAGNRVTFQDRFKQKAGSSSKEIFQRLARGNTLLENAGDGTFRDVSEIAGVTMGRWSWGSLFVDFNNDGWQDLLVLNGFLTQNRLDDL
jgi:hypothetical protein